MRIAAFSLFSGADLRHSRKKLPCIVLFLGICGTAAFPNRLHSEFGITRLLHQDEKQHQHGGSARPFESTGPARLPYAYLLARHIAGNHHGGDHRLCKTERQKRRKGLFPRCPARRNKNENLKEKGAPLNQRSAQSNGCTVRRQHPHKPDCHKRQRNSIHRSGPERLPARRQGDKGHRRDASAYECPSPEKTVRILVGKPHSRRCHHIADECRKQDSGQDSPRHARQLPRPIEQLIEQSTALAAMRPTGRASTRLVATEYIAPARIDVP